MSNSVLLVAFDGMDSEKISELNLENIPQEEFGTIDNDSGMYQRNTVELFVSLLTGETHQSHGVKGLNKWSNDFVQKFENFADSYWALRKFAGIRKSFYEKFTPANRRWYYKKDYEQETLFEKIDNSKALDVPGYRPLLSKGASMIETWGIRDAERQQNAINDYKQRKLLDLVEKDYNFIMAHFHKIDHFHHWFWEVDEEEKAWKAYHEADEYAGKLKEKAFEEGFDYVIFMSDHGLPTESQHNKNAFYSCNKELFGNGTPHITDFHDKILEIIGKSKSGKESKSEKDSYSQEKEEEVKSRLEDLGYM